MGKCTKSSILSLVRSKISITGQFQTDFFGNFSERKKRDTSTLPGLWQLCEYSVNKSTSVHPQSKPYQLLFLLHKFSAAKGKIKIISPGHGGRKTHTV